MHCATSRRPHKLIAAALLLAITLTSAHSQTARNADLARIRADIARLRTRLDDLRTQTRSAEHDLEEADLELGIRTNELQLAMNLQDRKSTRLNSSHPSISYAVFCLKKKKTHVNHLRRGVQRVKQNL